MKYKVVKETMGKPGCYKRSKYEIISTHKTMEKAVEVAEKRAMRNKKKNVFYWADVM